MQQVVSTPSEGTTPWPTPQRGLQLLLHRSEETVEINEKITERHEGKKKESL